MSTTTSFSEISTYHTCRKRRWYQYVKRVPQKVSHKLALGSVVHAGMQAAILAQMKGENIEYAVLESCAKCAAEQPQEETEGLVDASAIALRAVRWLNLTNWETLVIGGKPAVEIALSAKVIDGVDFVTRLDWVARNRDTGQAWSFEFKVRKQLTPEALGEVSLQQATQQYVLAQHGFPIEGAIEFAIRDQLPNQPKQNKDGKMSRAACATDWPTYLAALVAAGLNPADYEDVRIDLESKEWFRLVTQYRTMDECNRIWEAVVVPTTREIQSGLVQPIPVLAKHVCRGCSYLEPCMEDVRGYAAPFEIELEVES